MLPTFIQPLTYSVLRCKHGHRRNNTSMNFSDQESDPLNSLRTPDSIEIGETPGEGTGPTRTVIPVGRVPSPGESGPSMFLSAEISIHGIRTPQLGNGEGLRSIHPNDGSAIRPHALRE